MASAVDENSGEVVLTGNEVFSVADGKLVDGCCEVPSTGVVSSLEVGEVTMVVG